MGIHWRMKVESFKQFSLKMLRCEARAFPVGMATCLSRPFFTLRKMHMRRNLDTWLAAILFLGGMFFASSIIAYWRKYASNKGKPTV